MIKVLNSNGEVYALISTKVNLGEIIIFDSISNAGIPEEYLVILKPEINLSTNKILVNESYICRIDGKSYKVFIAPKFIERYVREYSGEEIFNEISFYFYRMSLLSSSLKFNSLEIKGLSSYNSVETFLEINSLISILISAIKINRNSPQGIMDISRRHELLINEFIPDINFSVSPKGNISQKTPRIIFTLIDEILALLHDACMHKESSVSAASAIGSILNIRIGLKKAPLNVVDLFKISSILNNILCLTRNIIKNGRVVLSAFNSYHLWERVVFDSCLLSNKSAQKKKTKIINILDLDDSISIIPDVIVKTKSGESVIVDAKYKYLDSRSINQDIYQVNSYMDIFSIKHAFLIYPDFRGVSTKLDFDSFIEKNDQEGLVVKVVINDKSIYAVKACLF